MKWMTWENVGIDRMACAWLIRRFIDTEPEFLFIPRGLKPETQPDTQPFDIPGVLLSHHRGHCTFHTMMREYHLDDPVLLRIARIIDEADIVQDALLEPIALGLDAVCRGIRMVSQDDYAAFKTSYPLFEGLYAYLKSD